MSRKFFTRIPILIFVSILMGLVFMAILGYYNRYWSDDWCYERDLDHLGVVQTLNGYFSTGESAIRGYSTNRYGLTLLVTLLYLLGLPGTQLLPAIIIGSLIAALAWLAFNVFREMGGNKIHILMAILFFVYFLLYFSPHRFQVLYWRAGIHYTAVIIILLLLMSLIQYQAKHAKPHPFVYGLSVLLAFVGGGLSEIGCVYLLTGLSLLLLWSWHTRRQGKVWAVRSFPLIVLIAVVLLISMLSLIASPSNDRYKEKADNPIPLSMVPFTAIRFSFSFILTSLKTLPLPHLIFSLFFFMLPTLMMQTDPGFQAVEKGSAILFILITGVVVFTLITAIQLPTTVYYSAPPDARGQSLSRFTMLAGLAVIAFITGSLLGSTRHPYLGIVSQAALLIVLIYSIRMINSNLMDYPGFVQRAQQWDSRDQLIRVAIAEGQSRIEVPVIDTSKIDTRDIMRSVDMERWVSNCASQYYGAEAFHAASAE